MECFLPRGKFYSGFCALHLTYFAAAHKNVLSDHQPRSGNVSNANDWTTSWMNSQQNYWKAWSDLAQRGMKAPEAPKNPLADGLAQWWQAVSPMTPPDGRQVFDKLMDVSKGYFTMAERFMSGTQNKPDGGMEAINAWLENMQKSWSDWSQMGSAFRPDAMFGADQFKGMNTFLDLPMDTWNRLAANIMPMPGDYTKAFHQNGSQPMQDQFNKFMSVPAVGYSRESQEQYQILAQRQMDYLAATQAYQMAFGKLGMESGKGFQAALQERMKEGKPISSLRELYDQWVEMSEAAYAEFVMTEEYQTLYGRLVNTLAGAETADGAHGRSDPGSDEHADACRNQHAAVPSTGVASRQPEIAQGAEVDADPDGGDAPESVADAGRPGARRQGRTGSGCGQNPGRQARCTAGGSSQVRSSQTCCCQARSPESRCAESCSSQNGRQACRQIQIKQETDK
jgi:class III poly(R)-hydroxyalkanoic acid synthase PhaE subunit